MASKKTGRKGSNKKGSTKSKAKSASSKGKGSESRLSSAMKSINNNRTPISSIIKKTAPEANYRTSGAALGKGTKRATSVKAVPYKLLVAISDPGKAPSAPQSPKGVNPVTPLQSQVTTTTMLISQAQRAGNSKIIPGLQKQLNNLNAQVKAAQQSPAGQAWAAYETANKLYQAEDAAYQDRVAQRNAEVAQNVRTTTNYQSDLNKFYARARKHKGKTFKSLTGRRAGARGGKSTLTGRGSRR